jgi:hypothetical protein
MGGYGQVIQRSRERKFELTAAKAPEEPITEASNLRCVRTQHY